MPDTLPLLEVLRATERYLGDRGVDNPRLNAEHLLAHALGLKRMELYLQFDRPLGESERAPLRDMVKRRGAREPLQHVLGTVEFHGRVFACDRRALVPRPETEQLVELALDDGILRSRDSLAVLDIGTGSGVIALTIALALPAAEVDATDLSTDALALAAENAARHALTDCLRWHHSDLFPPGDGRFDLIIANLPYIPTDELPALASEVQHDPRAALDGGPDGLDIIRRLIASAPGRLAPGGALLLEIGAGQADAVETLLKECKFRDISIRPDYQDVPRFAVGFHG